MKHCEPAIKSLLTSHNKCNTQRSVFFYTGGVMNTFLGLSDPNKLNLTENFRVCSNLAKQIDDSFQQPTINTTSTPGINTSSPPVSQKRVYYHSHHTRGQPNPYVRLSNLKGIRVSAPNLKKYIKNNRV